MKYNILIIEDEKAIARFMQLELEHEGYQVTIVNNGLQALTVLEEGKIDLAILDLMLPGISGIEVCRRVRQFSDLPIIMVTAKDETADKVTGLDMGADDYLTKPFAVEELLARIRRLLRRSQIKEERDSVLAAADLRLNTLTYEVTRAGKAIDLTKKEYELLHFLLYNQGIVLSREKILENVWGYDYNSDTNIVDVYIRYLRSKIDEPFTVKLIQTVRGIGYVLRKNEKC
ncbi:MAG: response regulator transcription factor [bacterium]